MVGLKMKINEIARYCKHKIGFLYRKYRKYNVSKIKNYDEYCKLLPGEDIILLYGHHPNDFKVYTKMNNNMTSEFIYANLGVRYDVYGKYILHVHRDNNKNKEWIRKLFK